MAREVKAPTQRIGIMGGMFDPVHKGHLQLAENVRASCRLDRVILVPCGTPVHRDAAHASAGQRISMLELACGDSDWLQVDTRECRSAAPSYTWTTLTALKAEQPQSALFLLMGLDAFLLFDTWYRWQELFALAHIVVATRAGHVLAPEGLKPALRTELAARLTTRVEDTDLQPVGRILLATLQLPDISSTQVRQEVRAGANLTSLLPAAVAAYIKTHKLYQ